MTRSFRAEHFPYVENGFQFQVDALYLREFQVSRTRIDPNLTLLQQDLIAAHGGTVAGTQAAFIARLVSGRTYLNIQFPVSGR